MEPFESDTIDTPAGQYVVRYVSDEAENPLTEYGHPDMQFYVSGFDSITTDTLSTDRQTTAGRAGSALTSFIDHDDDDVTRRFAKWRAISGSPIQLFTGSGYGNMQGDQWDWYVLVDARAWTGEFAARIEPAVLSTMAEYEAWATGDVFGWMLVDPAGNDVASVWGYYGFDENRDYVLSEATAAAEHHATDATNRANLVGSGFIDII